MVDVSYIIPAKNEVNYIGECIQSIKMFGSMEGGIEIIVVDNGSTDGTQEVVKAHGAVLLNGQGLSIAGLRNLGAEFASGSIIAFIDADILLLSGWIQNVSLALSNPKVGLVGSSPELPTNPTWVENIWHLKTKCMPQVWERPWLASMNMALRKSIFEEIGGFNTELVTCEDVDFGLRLGQKYKIVNDKSIRAVHLGNAKTLKDLYFKERWRATSNYQGLFLHGLILSEIPSLLWPIISLLSFILFFCSFLYSGITLQIFFVGLFLILPLSKSIQISFKLGSVKYFPFLVIVWSTYALSRLDALLRALMRKMLSFCS